MKHTRKMGIAIIITLLITKVSYNTSPLMKAKSNHKINQGIGREAD